MKEQENSHESCYIQNYFLAHHLTKRANTKYPQWLILTRNNFPKSLNEVPFYYKDVIETVRSNDKIFETKTKSAKNIRAHLTNANENQNIQKIQMAWDARLQKSLPWTKIWERSFKSYASGPNKNTLWRALTNSLPTWEKIQGWRKNRGRGNANCKSCGAVENTLHPLIHCTKARSVWKAFKKYIRKTNPRPIF